MLGGVLQALVADKKRSPRQQDSATMWAAEDQAKCLDPSNVSYSVHAKEQIEREEWEANHFQKKYTKSLIKKKPGKRKREPRLAFDYSLSVPRTMDLLSKDQQLVSSVPDRYDHVKHDRKQWSTGVPLSTEPRVMRWSPVPPAPIKDPARFDSIGRATRTRLSLAKDAAMREQLQNIHASGARGAAFPMVHGAKTDHDNPSTFQSGSIADVLRLQAKSRTPGALSTAIARFKPMVGDTTAGENTLDIAPGAYSGAFEDMSIRRRTGVQPHSLGTTPFASHTPRFETRRQTRRSQIERLGSQTARTFGKTAQQDDWRNISEEDYLAALC